MRENERMYHQLKVLKSSIDFKKMKQEEKKNLKIVKNMSFFPQIDGQEPRKLSSRRDSKKYLRKTFTHKRMKSMKNNHDIANLTEEEYVQQQLRANMVSKQEYYGVSDEDVIIETETPKEDGRKSFDKS